MRAVPLGESLMSRRSVGVLRQLGPEIQWIESYVAGNNLYCVYLAPDEEMEIGRAHV